MSDSKRRFLLRASPLTEGGKARLMSAKKVKPKSAKPREVSKLEAHGYTDEPHKGLKGEPECVGPAIVDAYGESARYFDTLRHAREVAEARELRKLLTAEQRLVNVQERARKQHRNLTGETHVCQKMLERAKAGGRKEPLAAIERIERMEADLDNLPEAA